MGLVGEGGGFDHFRIAGQGHQQFLFVGLHQLPEMGQPLFLVPCQAFFRQLAHHAANAGVGILNVIDRIVAGLGLGQVQVEVHVLFALAHHVEETCGVVAHFPAQLAQGDELPGTGGHGDLLPAPPETGELYQQHVQALGIVAQGRQCRLDPRHVAVVIGTPDVDDALEAPFHLVHVIGDVVGEVGGLAVVADYHPVFFVAELGGAEPPGAVPFVEIAALFEALDGTADQAAFHQAAFRIPFLVDDAEFLQVFADVVENGLQPEVEHQTVVRLAQQGPGPFDERVDVAFLVAAVGLVGRQAGCDLMGGAAQAFAMEFVQGRGDVDDVLTLIAIGGKRQLFAAALQVA